MRGSHTLFIGLILGKAEVTSSNLVVSSNEKTALLLVFETSSKSIAFSLVFFISRPNAIRTLLANWSCLIWYAILRFNFEV